MHPEDFEYAGDCTVCKEPLDMSEAGFCQECRKPFCWSHCGNWWGGRHTCHQCKTEEEDLE